MRVWRINTKFSYIQVNTVTFPNLTNEFALFFIWVLTFSCGWKHCKILGEFCKVDDLMIELSRLFLHSFSSSFYHCLWKVKYKRFIIRECHLDFRRIRVSQLVISVILTVTHDTSGTQLTFPPNQLWFRIDCLNIQDVSEVQFTGRECRLQWGSIS